MGHDLDFELPVHDSPSGPGEGPACGPTAYVSNEEAAILSSMRELKHEADRVRAQRSGAESELERHAADRRLDELRALWSDLAKQRESAFRRKMIMLGHLPPDEGVTLF